MEGRRVVRGREHWREGGQEAVTNFEWWNLITTAEFVGVYRGYNLQCFRNCRIAEYSGAVGASNVRVVHKLKR